MVAQQAFDASKHLTKVSGRDYLEVKWRLVWLRTDHPEAQIETELMQHEKSAAVFRARVSCCPAARAPPAGAAEASDDFGDYLEKAETKALGRALAALGFGTQFCQDYDFGAERQRVVDSPIDVRGNGSGRAQGLPRQEATPKQVTYLHAIAREAGLSEEDLELRARESFSLPLAELGRREVSALIEQIQSERTVS